MSLSYGASDYVEGGVITVVIIGNVLIDFWQEYKAEKKKCIRCAYWHRLLLEITPDTTPSNKMFQAPLKAIPFCIFLRFNP